MPSDPPHSFLPSEAWGTARTTTGHGGFPPHGRGDGAMAAAGPLSVRLTRSAQMPRNRRRHAPSSHRCATPPRRIGGPGGRAAPRKRFRAPPEDRQGAGAPGTAHRLVRRRASPPTWSHSGRDHRHGAPRRHLVEPLPRPAAGRPVDPYGLLRARRGTCPDIRRPQGEPAHRPRARQSAPRDERGLVERQARTPPRQPQPRGQGPRRRGRRPGLDPEAGRAARGLRPLAHPQPGAALLPDAAPRRHRAQDLRIPVPATAARP